MPELPEVETIRRDMETFLRGRSVVEVDVRDQRLMNAKEAARWEEVVYGQAWDRILRRGKYLLIDLANGWRIVFHLRMTGQLLLGMKPEPGAKWRMHLRFNDGTDLFFCDQRRFGEVRLLEPGRQWHNDNLPGPDALNELNQELFIQMVKRRTTRIQPLLMDQRILSGIGNIYAQEALFKASIRPSRHGNRVSRAEAARLYEALRETLQTAIDHRGSTSRNYRDAYGRQGAAQRLHAVYRKGGQPCRRCTTPLRAARIGGRGTVYCPQCQR